MRYGIEPLAFTLHWPNFQSRTRSGSLSWSGSFLALQSIIACAFSCQWIFKHIWQHSGDRVKICVFAIKAHVKIERSIKSGSAAGSGYKLQQLLITTSQTLFQKQDIIGKCPKEIQHRTTCIHFALARFSKSHQIRIVILILIILFLTERHCMCF